LAYLIEWITATLALTNVRVVGRVSDIRQSTDDGRKIPHQDLDVKKATGVGGIQSVWSRASRLGSPWATGRTFVASAEGLAEARILLRKLLTFWKDI
jgi:hypothetical protein